MYFKYILFLTLAAASKGIYDTSSVSGTQEEIKVVYKYCARDQFKCDNGECIPGKERCDGGQRCQDGSDELNCTNCTDGAVRCGDGECIYKGSVCNLYDDCEDGSDEKHCTNRVCGSDEFRCASGECIDKSGRCNGLHWCADGSDEENCLECNEYLGNKLFKCVTSNTCIFQNKVCDSINDCLDGSDEDIATCQNLKCADDEVQCGTGHCVHRLSICDGTDPCGDSHKMEKAYSNCTECPHYMFKCKSEDKCIYNSRLCDTVPDCEDGSDKSESTCSVLKCRPQEFQCQNGQCVKDDYAGRTLVCNGHHDCKDESDKSDEANCTTCSFEAIKCGSGECVHKLNLCNSIAECSDESDENKINCPHGSTPPVLTTLWRETWNLHILNVTLQHSTQDLAVYFDSGVSPSVTWPFSPLSQAWKYAKKTFKLETLSEPGSQFLYVVLGRRSYEYGKALSFRSRKSGYRNIVDSGLRKKNAWATQNSTGFEKLVSAVGYIVKIAREGDFVSADYRICHNTLRNIVFYDIYTHLKGQESADVLQWKATQFNLTMEILGLGKYNCFRDWFLPVYEKYGGATVLNNYFDIFKRNWPKKLNNYSEFTHEGYTQLNVGEFVHFWSGAAGEDLRYLANSAFHDWGDVFLRQFTKAQTDFPDITYPGEGGNILNVFVGTLICILIVVFIALTMKLSLPLIKKMYVPLIEKYW